MEAALLLRPVSHSSTAPVRRYQSPTVNTAIVPGTLPPRDALSQVLRAYDRALLACTARESKSALEGICLLRAALELDCETSRAFDALFVWCEEAVLAGNFAGAIRCLSALRTAWATSAQIRPLNGVGSVSQWH